MNQRKLSHVTRGLLAGATLLAAGGALSLAATPAGASNTQISAVGSFTTFTMMKALFPTTVNNINPNPLTGSASETIAADPTTCVGGIKYSTTTSQPPNGSGAGKTALKGEQPGTSDTSGCIDFSRSSSPPAPHIEDLPSGSTEHGDPTGATFQYYAYAIDGVAPLVGSASGATASNPITLSLATVQKIYKCTPTYTSWGGSWDPTGNGQPIVRFWPQSGSGTRAVYTDLLGFDPSKITQTPTCSTTPLTSLTNGTKTTVNEENAETGIIYENSVDPGALADAIYIYSAGKLVSQWNDPASYKATANNGAKQTLDGSSTPDNTLGNFSKSLTLASMYSTSNVSSPFVDFTPGASHATTTTQRGILAVDGGTVTEAHEWYSHIPTSDANNPSTSNATVPGIRFVYNIADPQTPMYNGAKFLIGFDNRPGGTDSTLCHGDDSTVITQEGFVPMTSTPAIARSDQNGSYCREFPGLHFPDQ